MSLHNWSRQRSLVRPAASDSRDHRSPWYSKCDGPVADTERLARSRYKNIASAVAALLGSRSPFAVVTFVIAIVVYALNSVRRRAGAHIGNEILKFHPALTNMNSAAAIAFVVRIIRVTASLDHCAPAMMLSSELASLRKSVSSSGCANGARAITAATADSVFGEMAGIYGGFVAAGASTAPTYTSVTAGFGAFDYRQQAELKSRQIWFNCSSHAVSSFVGDGVVRGCGSRPTILSLAFNYPTKEAQGGASI